MLAETREARLRLWRLSSLHELHTWAQELGVYVDRMPTWAILDNILHHYPDLSVPGMDEEYVRMAAHLAVRNIDPDYRGYTPFGDVT